MAVAVPGRGVAALAATRRLLSGKALNNAVTSQHASVDRKVTAHHKSTHGCVLLGQNIRFICEIRLVLAAVDKDKAGVAAVVPVALVHRVCPSSTPAEACLQLC